MLRVVLFGLVLLVGANFVLAQEEIVMPPQCTTLIPITKNEIIKACAGSGHLKGDTRGDGVAVILKLGSKLNLPAVIKMYGEDGEYAGCLRRYEANNGVAYKARSYSNFSSCSHWPRSKIHKRIGKKKPLFFVINKTLGKCLMLNKSYSNVNSSQPCGS